MMDSKRKLPPITSQLVSIWLIFVLTGLGLQILIQHSALHNGELGWVARVASLANDFLLIWPFLLVLGLPVLGLGVWSLRVQLPVLRRLLQVLQVLLAWLIMLA